MAVQRPASAPLRGNDKADSRMRVALASAWNGFTAGQHAGIQAMTGHQGAGAEGNRVALHDAVDAASTGESKSPTSGRFSIIRC